LKGEAINNTHNNRAVVNNYGNNVADVKEPMAHHLIIRFLTYQRINR